MLALTALLYLAGLSRNGWANDFYAAAVQAGTKSWKAFFFGSFDASSFITVDKTPASLWVMELSARVFGLNYWSVLVPQALEGVASVGGAVRRGAALVRARRRAHRRPGCWPSTPVATLMFRFNNPDALLVLLMTAAAYAMVRAIESGRTRWIVLAGALLGFGFLTKMLQAFLVLPAFALVYLVAGPPRLGRRIWQLLAGGGGPRRRGGLVGRDRAAHPGRRPALRRRLDQRQHPAARAGLQRPRPAGRQRDRLGRLRRQARRRRRRRVRRVHRPEPAVRQRYGRPDQLAAAGRADRAGRAGVARPGRRPRTDRNRAAALLWGGWLLVTAAVFSFMAGIIHPYYTVALAPAIGALTGIGAVTAVAGRRA